MAISKEELAELCDARDKLCSFCEVNECEKCIVTNLINDAFAKCKDGEEAEEKEEIGYIEGAFECDAEHCAFNPHGICGFAALHHRMPVFSDEKGCEDFCYTEKEITYEYRDCL